MLFQKKGSFTIYSKAPCQQTQHCGPTTADIVECYMFRPFAHPVACCWELLCKVWDWSTEHFFFCSLIARSIAQKCWICLHSSSNIVGVTHAHLKGFKAWVKGFGAYEWLAISLARRPRTKLSFSQRPILRFSCALTFNYGDMKCHVTKNWEWRKLASWWRIYFFRINKLAFLKQDKHT